MGKKYIVRLTPERTRLKTLVSKGVANVRKICARGVLLKVNADGPDWTDEKTGEAFSIRADTV